MILYHYHSETGEYQGYSVAAVDPAERDLAINKALEAQPKALTLTITLEHWIIPAHCTPVAPSVTTFDPKKQTLHFLKGSWVLKDIP